MAPFLFVGIGFFLIACEQQTPVIKISGPTMGTTYNITLANVPLETSQSKLEKGIAAILLEVNRQMSTYLDSSEITQFNQLSEEQWFTISKDFVQVLLLSQQLSQLTQGKFDITIGPLIELWGFGRELSQEIPSDDAIANAKSVIGWDKLQIDPSATRIKKLTSLTLNVSAVAKGFAVDKVAEYLEQQGIQNYLVEIGGEMRVRGNNPRDELWRVGVEKPSLLQKSAQEIVSLNNKSIATSGDYRNYFEENGQRYSHTIDPNSGRPVRHNIASVTVIADTAAEADGFATALNVLGEEGAMALVEAEELAAYFIFYNNDGEGDYRIVYSQAFEQYLIEK